MFAYDISATEQVAKRSDIISLSLPSEKITSTVLFGDGGVLEGFLASGENMSGRSISFYGHQSIRHIPIRTFFA